MADVLNQIKENMREANIEISDAELEAASGGVNSAGDAPKFAAGDKVVVKNTRPGVILSVHENDTQFPNLKYYYTVHLSECNGYPERDMDVFESLLAPMA